MCAGISVFVKKFTLNDTYMLIDGRAVFFIQLCSFLPSRPAFFVIRNFNDS